MAGSPRTPWKTFSTRSLIPPVPERWYVTPLVIMAPGLLIFEKLLDFHSEEGHGGDFFHRLSELPRLSLDVEVQAPVREQ